MDEYANDGGDYEEDVQEEDIPEQEDDAGEEIEQSEQQRAEAADLVKLFRQHPEIWIPYSEQVQERLNIQAPDAASVESTSVSLRDPKILDTRHTTYPFLTSYERTKCISFRASQIANGAKPYILVPEGVSDSYEIAKMELEAKRLPFIIKRPLPDGSFEVWRLADLVIF
jgi:DNA-directed RNA polymerase I, II, and III subunit RPABC2